jgi:thermitase
MMITALLTATILATSTDGAVPAFADWLTMPPAELAEQPSVRRARANGEPFDADGIPLSAYRPAQVIVRARPGMEALLAACHRSIGASVAEHIERAGFDRVVLPAGLDVGNAVRLYRRQPFVLSAEHNFTRRLLHVPNDPVFNRGEGAQWAPKRINCQRVWDTTFGSEDVIIAIVDGGVDSGHNDLGGSLVAGRNTLNDNGNTWSDASASAGFYESHGTMCALIAVANHNNLNGIIGVAPGCRVMPIKAGDGSETLDVFAASEGIEWAADHGAQVINMSFGDGSGSLVEEWAVGHAASKGCILVASAGNDGVTTPNYPAAYPNVIAVAATDFQTDARLSWSNYGSWVDVAAPGMSIAIVPTGATMPYFDMGTSCAAPHVAGVAALLYPMFDHLGAIGARDAVIGRIRNYCDPVPGSYVAKGRVNAYDAMNYGNYNNHSSFAPYHVDPATYTLISGNAASLELGQGNDQRLVVQSKAFDQTTQFPPSYSERLVLPMAVKVSFPGTLKGFDILLESQASSALSVDVKAYNFSTSTYVSLGTISVSTADTTGTVSLSSTIAPNFLSVASDMFLKFEAIQSGSFVNPPAFQLRLDQVRVTTISL